MQPIDAHAAPTIELHILQLPEPTVSAGGFPTAATGSMLVLVALDLAGAYCAVRYTATGQQIWWAVGTVSYLVCFPIYAAALRWGELGTVTLAWLVSVQIGTLVIDWATKGTTLPASKLVAVLVIFAAMAYVLLAPNPNGYVPRHTAKPTQTSTSGARVMAQRSAA
jgi:hypothetical protein